MNIECFDMIKSTNCKYCFCCYECDGLECRSYYYRNKPMWKKDYLKLI